MDHQDVDAAMAEMLRVLGPTTAEDWTVPAGPPESTEIGLRRDHLRGLPFSSGGSGRLVLWS
jgi:hypothetical protein